MAHIGVGRAASLPPRIASRVPIAGANQARLIRIDDDDWEQLPTPGSGAGPVGPPAAERLPAGDHPQRGPTHAPVTIVEYADFQCPYCRQAERTLREVGRRFGDQVRVVHMDFPLSSHPGAMDAALAARCANGQGRFWDYHDALMTQPMQISTISLVDLAHRLGLNVPSFSACLSERRYESAVRADMAAGVRAGASGTPFFVVNGRPLAGAPSVAELSALVEQALRQKPARSEPAATESL